MQRIIIRLSCTMNMLSNSTRIIMIEFEWIYYWVYMDSWEIDIVSKSITRVNNYPSVNYLVFYFLDI